MKKEVTKTGNFEMLKKYAMNRDELKKVKGRGEWILIDGEWVWVEFK
jgi:hypothetical protein